MKYILILFSKLKSNQIKYPSSVYSFTAKNTSYLDQILEYKARINNIYSKTIFVLLSLKAYYFSKTKFR